VFFSGPFMENQEMNSEIRYIIDPKYRGRKLSNQLVLESSDKILELTDIHNIRAYIHPDNLKSQAAVLNSGFEISGQALDGIEFNKPAKR
ncbi:MAG: GNAT family N-acetyltransferase, partial [Bacilli bacterium]|nr:GNAT family N-acetyltransferase [Bacilli bacterium]